MSKTPGRTWECKGGFCAEAEAERLCLCSEAREPWGLVRCGGGVLKRGVVGVDAGGVVPGVTVLAADGGPAEGLAT